MIRNRRPRFGLEPHSSVENGDGPGDPPDMDELLARFDRIETDMSDVKSTLRQLLPALSGIQDSMTSLRTEVRDIRHDVAGLQQSVTALEARQTETRDTLMATRETLFEVKGRVSELPSTWQLLTLLVGTVMAVFTVSLAIPRLLP